MFYRLRRYIPLARLNREVKRIFATEPLRPNRSGVRVVSMVRTADLATYLLALKSFATAVAVGKVTAIVDRASPPDFRRTLEAHVPGIELVDLESIPVGSCQHGGTWERILYVLDQSEREYIIQLDADTLTLDPDLAEVRACIARNRAFTLGGGPAASGQRIVSMPEAAASLDFESDYIGITTQRLLAGYPGGANLRYVRGSSGFAGFALGGITRPAIEKFHAEIARLLSSRTKEWGTEQCASNFAIANTPGAMVLPWPAYANFSLERPPGESTRFLHFIGVVRYRNGCYAELAQRTIDRILAAKEIPCAA